MKYLYLFAFLLTTTFAGAIHVVGGHIQYTYVGNAQHPYRYFLEVIILLDDQAAGPPMQLNLEYESSCFSPPGIIGLGIDSIRTLDNDIYLCVDSLSPYYEEGYYSDTLDLPGACADWIFSFETCCRSGNVANLTDANLNSVYLESYLNNLYGHNSSPRFIDPPSEAFCIGNGHRQYFNQRARDAEGDSLLYAIMPSKTSGGYNIPFAPGYSLNQPVKSASGVSFDPYNGIMNFVPSDEEEYILTILVSEYRYDSVYNMWLTVGQSRRDVHINVTQHCNPLQQNWEMSVRDTILQKSDSINCGDKLLRIFPMVAIEESSVSPDGSEFRLVNKSTQSSQPITAVSMGADGSIELHLHKAPNEGDSLQLYFRKGLDGNTVMSKCNQELSPTDTLYFTVVDCQGASLVENALTPLIYPNPAKDHLMVDFPLSGDYITTLFTPEGQLIKEYTVSGKSAKISLDKLRPGLYLIGIQNKSAQHFMRFIKY